MAIFAKELSLPEGPVCLSDNTWIVTEMGPDRGCVTHLDTNGRAMGVISRTGRPNGLTMDGLGNVWVAESEIPSLLKVTLSGEVTLVTTGVESDPFLFPNDLCFGPNGKLYMTDSGILFNDFAPDGRIRSDYMGIDYEGRVYEFDPETEELQVVDSGLKFPNGIAFGPDGNLYVNETITGMVYKYDFDNHQLVYTRREFGNVLKKGGSDGFKGPDGMAFDAEGRLYVAVFGQRDITVLGTDGTVVNRIETSGQLPTNVAFGLDDRNIYVTENELGQIEVFDVKCRGLELYR